MLCAHGITVRANHRSGFSIRDRFSLPTEEVRLQRLHPHKPPESTAARQKVAKARSGGGFWRKPCAERKELAEMSPSSEVWRETSARGVRDSPWGTAGPGRMPNATRSGGAVGMCLDLIGEIARPADGGSSSGALSRSEGAA